MGTRLKCPKVSCIPKVFVLPPIYISQIIKRPSFIYTCAHTHTDISFACIFEFCPSNTIKLPCTMTHNKSHQYTLARTHAYILVPFVFLISSLFCSPTHYVPKERCGGGSKKMRYLRPRNYVERFLM